MTEKNKTLFISVFLAAITIFSGIVFFDWTLLPHLQMARYIDAVKEEGTDPAPFSNDAFIFSPETSAQETIREDAMTGLLGEHDKGILSSPSSLLDKALAEMQAYTDQHPDNYEDFVLVGKGYDTEASLKNDPALYVTAEAYYEKARAIMPDRQEGVYLLAINLMTQGNTQGGIALLQSAVALDPEIPSNHYELAEAYVVAGSQYYDDSLLNFEIALGKGTNLNPSVTKESYEQFLAYYYRKGDLQRTDTVVQRLETLDPAQKDLYSQISQYIETKHAMPALTIQSARN